MPGFELIGKEEKKQLEKYMKLLKVIRLRVLLKTFQRLLKN